MRQFLIFTFLLITTIVNSQDEKKFDFLWEQICKCIESSRKVNEKTQLRCQKKVFRKNKKEIKRIIEREDLKTDYDRIRNHFYPLTLQVKAIENVIDSCTTYRYYFYNEFLKPKREEIYEKIVNEYCPLINEKLKKNPKLDFLEKTEILHDIYKKYYNEIFQLLDYRDNKENSIYTFSIELNRYVESNCKGYLNDE